MSAKERFVCPYTSPIISAVLGAVAAVSRKTAENVITDLVVGKYWEGIVENEE